MTALAVAALGVAMAAGGEASAGQGGLSVGPIERFTLDNGLEVLLLEDHRQPQVVVDLWYGVGSYDDPEGASGFAHLFEHLMFMGTRAVPEGRFDQLQEAAGARNNASTGDDRTNYFDWGTSNTLDLLLWLEADRMRGLDITQEKLDLQREVVRNERRQNYEDRPYGRVWLDLPEMMYPPEHPYHRSGIGSHEDLLAATLDHVRSFYASWYAPNNATLVVAGDFDPGHVRERVEAWFGPIPPAEVPPHKEVPQPDRPHEARRTVRDQVALPLVVMAWHTPPFFAPGDAEMDVVADLLAGGPDARLTRRLVHDERVAQQVEAFQSSSLRGSLFVVMVFAQPDADLDAIEAAVTEEIGALAGERPAAPEELRRAVVHYEKSALGELEPLLGRAEKVQTWNFYTGHPDYLEQDLARYRALDADGLARAVSRYLAPDRAGVLRVLPEEGAP